jgi:hypothetical protein
MHDDARQFPIKKILEKIPINDHFSSFYSEKTQTRDHFSEKFFIGIVVLPKSSIYIVQKRNLQFSYFLNGFRCVC